MKVFGLCNESDYKPTPSLIQKYKNRCAIIATHKCLVYCCFCFRRDFVGISSNNVDDKQLAEAVTYIRTNPENRDILVSGGDPMALNNRSLIPLLRDLESIPHVKVIRIHTRALSSFPDRFDDEIIACLETSNKIWIYNHMNHPDDINHPTVLEKAGRLQSSGIPLLNQCVLLKGVNDDVQTLLKLMMICYENRIIPYHLYTLDMVSGTNHFMLSNKEVEVLFRAMSSLPGPAQPVLVRVDANNYKQRAVFSKALDFEKFIND